MFGGIMKKIFLLAAGLFLAATGSGWAVVHGGTPIIGGGTGILTVPTAATIGKGGIDLGFYWVQDNTFAGSFGIGLIQKLDLSVGFELDDDSGVDQDPFIHFRAKYRFYGSGRGGNSWAFGVDWAHAVGDAADPDDRVSIYLVNSYFQGAWGVEFTWGVGYTFDQAEQKNVNFLVGISKKIVPSFYIEADYSNFATRYFNGPHMDENRGVGNIAARLHLFEGKLRVTAGLYDAFDANRKIGLGLALKLNL